MHFLGNYINKTGLKLLDKTIGHEFHLKLFKKNIIK